MICQCCSKWSEKPHDFNQCGYYICIECYRDGKFITKVSNLIKYLKSEDIIAEPMDYRKMYGY